MAGNAPAIPGLVGVVYTPTTITRLVLDEFFAVNQTAPFIGMAGAYGAHSKLDWLAFCHSTQYLILQVSKNFKQLKESNVQGRDRVRLSTLLTSYLTSGARKFVAFDADSLTAALHLDMDIRISHLLHAQSIHVGKGDIDITAESHQLLQVVMRKQLSKIEAAAMWEDDRSKSKGCLAGLQRRAWIARSLPHRFKIDGLALIDTRLLSVEVMECVSKIIRESDEIDGRKPTISKHDFSAAVVNPSGQLIFTGARYSTRIQTSGPNQHAHVTLKGGSSKLIGKTVKTEGKTSNVKVHQKTGHVGRQIEVKSIVTIGKDAPTSLESQIRSFSLQVLCNNPKLLTHNPIIRRIWPLGVIVPQTPANTKHSVLPRFIVPLNPSQRAAVVSFCTTPSTKRNPVIQLTHGPPGTGKTTMIAAVVGCFAKRDIWIVAQSNVAVKNVAEKLFNCDIDFRLIVSKEFHFEWHEHLYHEIEPKVIQSAELPKTLLEMERMLADCRVMLCTLSMLSHLKLQKHGLTNNLRKPEILIADEASQIPIASYLPAFNLFSNSLERILFVGDHKQLAPFGQNEIPDLKSIFEIGHLVQGAAFLDTQYRMPHPIGRFISAHVYDKKLKTKHAITDPKKCIRFVNVADGKEVKKSGLSSQNDREVQIAVKIAERMQREGKKYRILTGYDAQRQQLENALKHAKLKWEDIVFNVDSFQGNQADYIIVSVVRTESPGFLSDPRRTNVMLSRCKCGMVILAKRSFLESDKACDTLVAKMALAFGGRDWMSVSEVMNGARIFR